MKSTLIICYLYIIFGIPVHAQNWKKTADSLQTLLTLEKSDSGKITLYLEISDLLIRNQPDVSFEFATEARELSEMIGDTNNIVESIMRLCDFYSQIGDHGTAMELAFEALTYAGTDSDLLGLCHNRIATVHSGVGNFRETLAHNRNALRYSSERKDSDAIMVDLHNIGSTFIDLEMYDSALYYLKKTNDYEIRKKGRPDPYSLSNIGSVYLKTERLDSALLFFILAYKYDQIDDQKFLMAIDQQSIAETYLKMGRLSEAKEYTMESINLAKELRANELLLEGYSLMYSIYQKEQNFKNAFNYSLLYNSVRDTLLEKSKQSLILSLDAKHRIKEKEARMLLLEKQRALYFILTLAGTLFIISLVLIATLINRRKRLYQELSHQLSMANYSKEQLLSVISHDLRSSVGTLKTAARVISENITDTESVKELLESFYPVADSTYDLLENLLTWTKLNKENITPDYTLVNIHDLISKTIEHMEHFAASKSVSVINKVDNETIRMDRNMILSVSRNLLNNSIKFSYPGNEVIIESRHDNGSVVLSFTDFGIGMNAEQQKQLLENPGKSMVTGTRGEKGSGLGLILCKTFIQLHGGDLWLESVYGKGSTFYFSLPVNK